MTPGCSRGNHERVSAPSAMDGNQDSMESRTGADRLKASPAPAKGLRSVLRWIMAAFYMLAGIGHLTLTDKFLMIVPDWVPFPRDVVLFTGCCEISGGIALMIPRLRRLAGIMLALYAICVFPANIKQAIEGIQVPSVPDSWWYHGPRLLFQPVLVWWALFCADVIDWPFKAKPEPKTTD
jgi:uncharacterized membrane protein